MKLTHDRNRLRRITSPAEFGKAVPQVFTPQASGRGGGDRRIGGGGGRGNAQPQINAGAVKRDPPTNPAGVVTFFAGSYGDKLLARLKSAVSAGGMGEVLRIAPAPIIKEVKPNQPDGQDPALVDAAPVDAANPGVDPADPANFAYARSMSRVTGARSEASSRAGTSAAQSRSSSE